MFYRNTTKETFSGRRNAVKVEKHANSDGPQFGFAFLSFYPPSSPSGFCTGREFLYLTKITVSNFFLLSIAYLLWRVYRREGSDLNQRMLEFVPVSLPFFPSLIGKAFIGQWQGYKICR